MWKYVVGALALGAVPVEAAVGTYDYDGYTNQIAKRAQSCVVTSKFYSEEMCAEEGRTFNMAKIQPDVYDIITDLGALNGLDDTTRIWIDRFLSDPDETLRNSKYEINKLLAWAPGVHAIVQKMLDGQRGHVQEQQIRDYVALSRSVREYLDAYRIFSLPSEPTKRLFVSMAAMLASSPAFEHASGAVRDQVLGAFVYAYQQSVHGVTTLDEAYKQFVPIIKNYDDDTRQKIIGRAQEASIYATSWLRKFGHWYAVPFVSFVLACLVIVYMISRAKKNLLG